MGALLALSVSSLAQSDFRKGFIVTHDKDTVFGFADFHDGVKAFSSCNFKRTENGESQTYKPADILGYGFVDDRHFVTRSVPANGGAEEVFMEVMVEGPVTLFRLRETFWVQKQGQDILELRKVEKEVYVDKRSYTKYVNEYIGTLNILLADCAALRDEIQDLEFRIRPLTKLIASYNSCQQPEVKVQKAKKPWIKANAGIAVGMDASNLKIDAQNYFHSDGVVPYKQSVSMMGGITLDISSPRLSERFAFTSAVLYTQHSYHLSNAEQQEPGIHYVTIDVKELKIPFGLRYTFAPKPVTPFFNVGMTTAIHLESSSTWLKQSVSGIGNVINFSDMGEIPTKKGQAGVWGGIGMLTRISEKFDASIELRYEYTNGIVDFELNDYTSNVTNFQLLVGLRIK
jgi:hypothetical protein